MKDKKNHFAGIGFEDFKILAKDSSLSKYEKIGFPNSYREGFEKLIFKDITSKLTNLKSNSQKVLDIGPGCSDLPLMLVEHCKLKKHSLALIDSQEMLDQLPDFSFVEKVNALFPNCPEFINSNQQSYQVILCYSVLQYILIDAGFFKFIDLSLSLLASGGQFLIGDIPNISKRKRFFSSQKGIEFHQAYTNSKEQPEVSFNKIEHDQIDDSIVLMILNRARSQGFDAYVLSQDPGLPMANRREDILIVRP